MASMYNLTQKEILRTKEYINYGKKTNKKLGKIL